jgi:hypothetical protein
MNLFNTKTAFWRTLMLRFLKALSFLLALTALSVFITSCGSGNATQIRFVNAIRDDATPLDIEVNGGKIFTDIGFFGYQPSSGYTKTSSGSVTIAGVNTGTTTQVFSSSASLGSSQYTLVATGTVTGTNGSAVQLLSIPDNNTVPAVGNVEFRVINAAPSTQNAAVDIYIIANGGNGGIQPPATIAALAYTQASNYITFPFNSLGSGYTMYVTSTGTTNPIFSQVLPSPTNSIRTLVLTDVQNGSSLNSLAVELSDLN